MESKNRKPLTDITNTYNLIPTSALRKLVSATSNSNSFPKPPLSILKSNSTSASHEFFSKSSSIPNTSIGSCNVSATSNSKTVQFRSPQRAISSIISRGGTKSKDAAYDRRQIIEKPKKEKKADSIVGSTSVEKKDKGKTIALPFSSPPADKMKDNQNDICNPSTSIESHNQNRLANLSLSSGSVEMERESEKGINSSCSCLFGKAEKGKAIFNSSVHTLGKQENIVKDIANNSCYSPERSNDGKKGSLKHTRSSSVKIKERGQKFLNSSSLLFEGAKDKGKPPNTFDSSLEKRWEEGKAILLPSDIVEIAKHKGSSAVKSSFLIETKDNGNPACSVNSSHEKTREKGKAILQPSDIPEVAVHKGPFAAVAVKSSFLVERAKGNGKPLNNFKAKGNGKPLNNFKAKGNGKPLNNFKAKGNGKPLNNFKAKDNGKPLITFNSFHEKTRKKRKVILEPCDIVEITEHKGSSAAMAVKSQPPRRRSEKRKIDAGVSSCPPMMRTKSMQNELDEEREIKSSKSWTDPHPKRRKQMCSRIENSSELTQDFIEQQKSYFKEVDEFELLEEEATLDELD